MNKFWIFMFALLSVSLGRENPFVPAGELNSSVVTTNIIETFAPFDRQNLKFPSDARNFISITLKYKSVDGSIKEKVIDINKSISWQDELVLQKQNMPQVVAKPDVSVTKDEPMIVIKPPMQEVNITVLPDAPSDQSAAANEQNLTKTNKLDTSKPMNPADINLTPKEPLKDITITPAGEQEPLKVIEFKGSKFEIYPMKLKILTADSKIKDFAIAKERKIALDFKGKKGFYTKSFKLDCGGFKSVMFGHHDSFYRASITLDGGYKYNAEQTEDGYIINLFR